MQPRAGDGWLNVHSLKDFSLNEFFSELKKNILTPAPAQSFGFAEDVLLLSINRPNLT